MDTVVAGACQSLYCTNTIMCRFAEGSGVPERAAEQDEHLAHPLLEHGVTREDHRVQAHLQEDHGEGQVLQVSSVSSVKCVKYQVSSVKCQVSLVSSVSSLSSQSDVSVSDKTYLYFLLFY